jgi:hypothetical protein
MKLPQKASEKHVLMVSSCWVSMKSASGMTLTIWLIKSCLSKKNLCQYVARKLATRKRTQISAYMVEDKSNPLNFSPLSTLFPRPERFLGTSFSSLR